MLENETKIDACVRICVTNFTFAQDEEEVITTTEQAYIEGATARKGFLSGLFLDPGQVRQQCCRIFEFFSNLESQHVGSKPKFSNLRLEPTRRAFESGIRI